MIITLRFDERAKPSTAVYDTFQLDIDASESIDNLKTLITLRYNELDPDQFELYYNGNIIKGEQKCIYIQETLQAKELLIILKQRSDCCILI